MCRSVAASANVVQYLDAVAAHLAYFETFNFDLTESQNHWSAQYMQHSFQLPVAAIGISISGPICILDRPAESALMSLQPSLHSGPISAMQVPIFLLGWCRQDTMTFTLSLTWVCVACGSHRAPRSFRASVLFAPGRVVTTALPTNCLRLLAKSMVKMA